MDRRNNCFIYVVLALTFLANSTLGDTLSPPAGLNPGDQFRWLFVTSTDIPNLADIPAFDSHVNGLAAAAGHATTGITSTPTFSEIVWRSVISTAASGAIPRLSNPGVPVYTLDGDLLGSDLTSLLTAGNTITEVQNENLASTIAVYVMTGITSGGGPSDRPVPIPFAVNLDTAVTVGVLSESTGWPTTFYNVNAFIINWIYHRSDPFRLYAISEPLTVIATSINIPPVANAGGPYLSAVDTDILFDGTGSSDPDSDPLTYAWDFADNGTGTGATPTYSYAAAGIYNVCLTVNDGTVDSDSVCTIAVIYDPSAGFVTGGGWIYSEPGYYAPDETLAGKANFGFVSKYKKGASTPTGNTEFQFKAGDLNFHSSSYDWLVVTGSNYAKFKGVGTINGSGEYKFQIWAGDDSPDTFRIKIWEEDGGGDETVVYDNGFNQEIGGGSIKIHTK